MINIYLSFQCMLSNPVVDGAVNEEAVDILQNSPDLYKQMVVDCVNASQKVFGKSQSYDTLYRGHHTSM